MRSLAYKAKNALAQAMRFLRGQGPGPDDDPYAAVRAPVKRGPPDKHASVALAEPE
jgi:hypothetical protein